jgi:hypothetical protein
MTLLLPSTYERFTSFLQERMSTKQHLTEDSVRYSFFLALLETTDIKQHELILELPHPKFPGKEIDTYIASTATRPELFVEFKFHRAAKSSSAKPQKAGSLFKDINRLASLVSGNNHCLVIYFTCSEMAKYFAKNEAAYSAFWAQPTGGSFVFDSSFVFNTSDTFRKVSGEPHRARVQVEFSSALKDGYHIRVFDVREV